MRFVDYGTDVRILKSIPIETLENLEKAHPGTVPKKVFVSSTKDGKAPHWTTVYTKDTSKAKEQVHKPKIKVEDLELSKFINPDANYFNQNTHKVQSLEQVIGDYERTMSSDPSGIEDYVKENFFVSDGEVRTVDVYRVRWKQYKPKRFEEVHQPVIDRKLAEGDTPPPGTKPACFMFGGGSGSGKSTVASSIVNPRIKKMGLKFAHIDCDELKNDIPEYELFKEENLETAAFRAHRESSDLCFECIDALIENKKCFTYDGVLGNPSLAEDLVTRMTEKGYDVYLIMTDVPTDVAIERASKRERKIPNSVIENAHNNFAAAFPSLIELPVKYFALYDNSQPEGQPPTCIMDSTGVKHQQFYDRFMTKSREAY